MFQFLFNTGARISEALSVDIDAVEKVGTSYKVSIIGKRGKARDIDFNEETYRAIEKYLVETGRNFRAIGPIFTTYRVFKDGSHRLTPKMADLIVKKYAAHTRLPRTKFFSHNFRHLIAKTLLDEGTSLDKVKNFLGHTNISTTAIYTMGKASELREAKSAAMRKAKMKLVLKNYDSSYHRIIEAIAEDSAISDTRLSEFMGISKATFSRRHKETADRIRGEFEGI